MRIKTAILAGCLATSLLWGCNTPKTHRYLAFFLDGVPEPGTAAVKAGARDAGKGVKSVAATSPRYREHGPFAAKQCQACHKKGTSELLLPADELCFNCHTLDVRKKYIHGPLASGGCQVCHDPHGSIHPFLLVSEPKEFCLVCHDRAAVAKRAVHEGVEAECTTCHDAHSSDEEYLLKE
jgi:predicted CXXCH cytochrome family protein